MARYHHAIVATLTAAIALAVSACSKPDEGKAPFAPPAGQAREIFPSEVVDTTLTVASMGMEGTMSQTTKMTLLATPGEPSADGSVNMDVTVDYMTLEQDGALLAAMADSMDMNPIFKAVSKGAIGKTFAASVAADGSVTNVSNYEGLLNGVVGELGNAVLPEAMDDAAKEQVENIAKQMYDDGGLQSAVERITVVRSLEKLDPGVTWTREINENIGLWPVISTYTYTVAERTDTNITVEETSAFTFDDSVPSIISVMKQNELIKNFGEPSFEMTGTGTGSYTIDPQTGWATSQNGTATLTGKFLAGPINADVNVSVTRDFASSFK